MDASNAAEPAALLERWDGARGECWWSRARRGSGTPGCSRRHASASELGIRVLNARATELEQGFPFGVVRQLFERPLLEADAGERARWLAGAAALAAEVITGSPTTHSMAPGAGPSTGDPGYAWHHGLYWLASNLAADSPLVLVVDDLHWCDAPSSSALAFIALPPSSEGAVMTVVRDRSRRSVGP